MGAGRAQVRHEGCNYRGGWGYGGGMVTLNPPKKPFHTPKHTPCFVWLPMNGIE